MRCEVPIHFGIAGKTFIDFLSPHFKLTLRDLLGTHGSVEMNFGYLHKIYTELGSLFRAMKSKGKINKHSICIGASKQPALLQLAFAWLPSRDHMVCLMTMSGRHHTTQSYHSTGKGSLSKSFKWHLAIKLSSPGALKAMPDIMSIWRRGFYALSHLDTSRHQDISWLAAHSGPSSASRSAKVTGLSATGRPGSCLDSISTLVARLSIQNEWVMDSAW